jgi:hypothetical protein
VTIHKNITELLELTSFKQLVATLFILASGQLHNAAPGLWSRPAREVEGTPLAPILVGAQRL